MAIGFARLKAGNNCIWRPYIRLARIIIVKSWETKTIIGWQSSVEDWKTGHLKSEIESFIGAKDPEMADIIVGLIEKPISRDETPSYKEKNAKRYITLKKNLKGAAANLIEKFRPNKNEAGALKHSLTNMN